MSAPRVVQKEGEEVPVEVLASAITAIAAGMERVNKSRLTRRALVILLNAETKVPFYAIEKVLNGLDDLEKTYCKPRAKK